MFTENDIEKLFVKEEYEIVHKSDFAIVLGCDTEEAITRADMAANFYFAGGAPKLIVSGGVMRDYGGKKLSECEIMRLRLIEKGVPESAIIDENRASDTIENMTCGLVEMCKSCEILKVRNVTVITQPHHIPRSVLTAKIFLPPYMHIFGYTEKIREYLEKRKADFVREIELLNWVIGDSGADSREITDRL